jgi:gluconokinase
MIPAGGARRQPDRLNSRNAMLPILLLNGVAGSGKTTIGRALARHLDVPFYDGDDFHPPQNVAKMARGEPLDDADRAPWLARLHELIAGLHARNKPAVIACSALKKAYRRQLARDLPNVAFVHLQGSFDLIHAHLRARQDHYMGAAMLRSQFDALEPPAPHEAIIVSIDDSVETIVHRILAAL